MTGCWLTAVGVVLAGGFALAAPIPKELKKKDDASRLVGSWVQGPRTGNQQVSIWVFAEDGTAVVKNGTSPPTERVKYKLDQVDGVKTFTWDAPWGKWHGIYSFDDDVFKIAIVSATAKVPLPTELKPGSGYEYHEFTRHTD